MPLELLVSSAKGNGEVNVSEGDFTLSVLFSRQWLIKPFFKAFRKLEVPLDHCHLLFLDNTDKAPLGYVLKKYCEDFIGYFKSVRLYKTYREGGRVIMGGKHNKVYESKLPSIILGYLDIAKLTNTEILINIEDDTLVPPHAIMQLLKDREIFGKNSFISGVESNRGDDISIPTRLGVYWVRCKDNKLLERVSASPRYKGCVSVDACGHFCFITSTKLFRRGFKNMYSFLNKSTHFAPDTYHTYNLKTKGVKIIADFGIKCIHIHPTPRRILRWSTRKAISTLDYYIPEWDHWANPTGLRIHVKKRPKWWD